MNFGTLRLSRGTLSGGKAGTEVRLRKKDVHTHTEGTVEVIETDWSSLFSKLSGSGFSAAFNLGVFSPLGVY